MNFIPGYFVLQSLESSILTKDGKFCIKPKVSGCSPPDGTVITLHDKDCDADDSKFKFDASKGRLIHSCSGKPICTRNGESSHDARIIVDSKCQFEKYTSGKHFMYNTLSEYNCFHIPLYSSLISVLMV